MKRVYVCGSFKFLSQIEELENMLRREGIEFVVSKSLDARGILGCLEKVDQADIVYVVNPRGYVGKSVSVDIGYAYAKNKPIYVMHSVEDPPVMSMVKGVLSFSELINLLKQDGKLEK
jgi:nucleoside 2-deoxyribosyltransferase